MTNEFRRIPEGYIREVQNIAVEECANCDDGNCLLLDDGEPCVCPQSISHSLWCKYFLTAVLPSHRDLYYTLCGYGNEKRCKNCGQAFYPRNNSAKYCDDCRIVVNREQSRKRMKRKRDLDVTQSRHF